jgi:hypothetical protein
MMVAEVTAREVRMLHGFMCASLNTLWLRVGLMFKIFAGILCEYHVSIFLPQSLQYPLEQNSGSRKVMAATFSETSEKNLYS